MARSRTNEIIGEEFVNIVPDAGRVAPTNSGIDTIVIGPNSDSYGADGIVIGYSAQGGGNFAIAIGYQCTGSGNNVIAIGSSSSAFDPRCISIGESAFSGNTSSVAIGYSASANSASCVAIGAGATATAANAIQLGNGTNSIADSLGFRGVKIANTTSIQALVQSTGVDPVSTPADGTIIVDDSSNELFVRVGGAWLSTTLT